MKIYTPEAWLSLFGGSPSLVIDDNGYIYSADGYYKIISDSPIGKIDYAKGYIYDKHYTDMFPTPIAEMVTKDDVTEVYQYGGGMLRAPILYIKNEKIYTSDEYLRIFGGNASGYIHRDKGSAGSGSSGSSTSGSGSSGGGFAVILGLPVLIGIIYLLTSETRIASAAMVLAIAVHIGAVVYFLWKAATVGLHFEWSGKRFAKGLVTAFTVYLVGTMILVILGVFSNIGTKGSPLSDANGDKMELAAMLMGIPFLLNGLLAEGHASGTAKTKQSGRQTYTPPKTTKPKTTPQSADKPKSAPKSNPQPQSSGTKIVSCPYCGAKCRIPAGNGRIRLTCPNPACGHPYEIDT